MRIGIKDNEYVTIVYGDYEIEVGISNIEPQEQLPELEIILPQELAVNCWGDHLHKARPISADNLHVRIASQLCIPLTKESQTIN